MIKKARYHRLVRSVCTLKGVMIVGIKCSVLSWWLWSTSMCRVGRTIRSPIGRQNRLTFQILVLARTVHIACFFLPRLLSIPQVLDLQTFTPCHSYTKVQKITKKSSLHCTERDSNPRLKQILKMGSFNSTPKLSVPHVTRHDKFL